MSQANKNRSLSRFICNWFNRTVPILYSTDASYILVVLVVYLSRISFIRTGTVLFDHLEQVFVNELKTECFRASKFITIWTNEYLHACSKIGCESSVKIGCSTFVGNLVVLSNIQNRTFHLHTPPHRLLMPVKVDTWTFQNSLNGNSDLNHSMAPWSNERFQKLTISAQMESNISIFSQPLLQ